MRPATDAQTAIAGFIAAFADKNGLAPSVAEIAEHFGYRSANAAEEHLKALIAKGYAQRTAGVARSIRLTDSGSRIAWGADIDPVNVHERAAKRAQRKHTLKLNEEQECRAQTEWGVSAAGVDYIRKVCAQGAYERQKSGARRRGIAWLFTRATWWRVWLDSGRYEERGPLSHQYVMARHGDEGPYAPWNVSIKTAYENVCEVDRSNARPPKGAKGWVVIGGRYYARFRGKYLGSFKSPEDAAAAYQAHIAALFPEAA